MSGMKLVKDLTYKIINPEPISETSIHKARYKFKEIFIDDPDTLVCHPTARYELLSGPYFKSTASFDTQTIFGMTIEVDTDLNGDEWYLKKTDERVEAVK